jgi:hypothetical protein
MSSSAAWERSGVLPEARGASADGDHVDGVAGGVMEVAGNADPLFCDREPALPLRLALGALGTLLEVGDLLAPQPRSFAGEPGDREGKSAVEQLTPREARLLDPGGDHVGGEEPDDRDGGAARPGVFLVAACRQEVEGGTRTERYPERVAQPSEQGARHRDHGEGADRGSPPGDERR